MNSLHEKYNKEIAGKLKEKLSLANIHQVPKLVKININVGIGTYLKGSSDYKPVMENIANISGQMPVMIEAKKSVSNFKLREGQPNGIAVTLRKERMYDFMYKLVNIVFPRLRDFRGMNYNSFDGNGNYSLGITEYAMFPEIELDDVVKSHGVQVTIVTSTSSDEHAKALLEEFGFPFKKKKTTTK